ncbi:MAG: GTP-binding protein [Promethearchaeota archaeon]|nr:MAG: GTP-binding protein [Candidatus Lokiarchaeota archaeon]
MEPNDNIYRYKLVLFGNAGVGKTSLVERFVNNKFEENYLTTLGYNVYEKWISCDGSVISLMVYDIGGQEKFTDLRKKYAEGANTAFLVYDITKKESFAALQKWKKDLADFAGNIPFIVIGNKNDLEGQREVPIDFAKQICGELGALNFFETSAKTGIGVEEAFQQLAIQTYQVYMR